MNSLGDLYEDFTGFGLCVLIRIDSFVGDYYEYCFFGASGQKFWRGPHSIQKMTRIA